ncbi:hypothetical protein B0T16DRAFT_90832 [Cercophora newfieldiana]|uniref:Uncharacterized protein n=1 Tax=Cercophora newfieldiana TaxID=92897 RepID=A0AA39YG09_9PEZI|nr:hypothetical protein B0T16DRAFT_90832 [Cercophora newfieldiana]
MPARYLFDQGRSWGRVSATVLGVNGCVDADDAATWGVPGVSGSGVPGCLGLLLPRSEGSAMGTTDSDALPGVYPSRAVGRARAWPAKGGWGVLGVGRGTLRFRCPGFGFWASSPSQTSTQWTPTKGPHPISVACRPVQLSRRATRSGGWPEVTPLPPQCPPPSPLSGFQTTVSGVRRAIDNHSRRDTSGKNGRCSCTPGWCIGWQPTFPGQACLDRTPTPTRIAR